MQIGNARRHEPLRVSLRRENAYVGGRGCVALGQRRLSYPPLRHGRHERGEIQEKRPPKSVLRFETRRQATGRTSVTYHVDVFCRQIESRDEEIVFSTDITFVCVDNNGVKTPINS